MRRGIGRGAGQRIVTEVEGHDEPGLSHDSPTNYLIRRYRTHKQDQRGEPDE